MDIQQLFIKPAGSENFGFYYSLKCEKENIYWSGFQNAPEKDKLHDWYMEKIKCLPGKGNYQLYIIYILSDSAVQEVGYISIYPSDCCKDCSEMSIGIASAFSNKGLGTRAIKEAAAECRNLGYHKLLAYIKRDNTKSRAAFTKAGFTETGKSKVVFFDSINSIVTMLEYAFEIYQ